MLSSGDLHPVHAHRAGLRCAPAGIPWGRQVRISKIGMETLQSHQYLHLVQAQIAPSQGLLGG